VRFPNIADCVSKILEQASLKEKIDDQKFEVDRTFLILLQTAGFPRLWFRILLQTQRHLSTTTS
jgi:hypothetical protein